MTEDDQEKMRAAADILVGMAADLPNMDPLAMLKYRLAVEDWGQCLTRGIDSEIKMREIMSRLNIPRASADPSA